MRHLSSLAFTLAFGVIVSCASSEEATPGDESDIKTKCQATLTYWQKDAYMDVGRRTGEVDPD